MFMRLDRFSGFLLAFIPYWIYFGGFLKFLGNPEIRYGGSKMAAVLKNDVIFGRFILSSS